MPKAMNIAKTLKVDEFYTMMGDVEAELQHYAPFFIGKSVYCCCDHPKYSNFFKFFCEHFDDWKLKEVVCSCKKSDNEPALIANKRTSSDITIRPLIGDGSYDSEECIAILSSTDIVVTNPPFSKSQEFIKLLIQLDKQFLIVCNRNTVVTKAIFPFFKDGKLKYGFGFRGNTANFIIPPSLYGHYSKDVVRGEQNIVRFRNVTWVTNMNVKAPCVDRIYNKKYKPRKYPKYDQYDAINVDKIVDIPYDYYGEMGVPITFLEGFDYNNFELIGLDRFMPLNTTKKRFTIKGKEKYARLIIKRKRHDGKI